MLNLGRRQRALERAGRVAFGAPGRDGEAE